MHILAYTPGILRVFCSDGFPYVIAPAFSTPAFSTPAFSTPTFSAPPLSEAVAKVYERYGISTAMRSHGIILPSGIYWSHPKDKINIEETAECVYA